GNHEAEPAGTDSFTAVGPAFGLHEDKVGVSLKLLKPAAIDHFTASSSRYRLIHVHVNVPGNEVHRTVAEQELNAGRMSAGHGVGIGYRRIIRQSYAAVTQH